MTKQPLIITGMHRSGTSLTASFLQSLGMDVGEKLYARDRSNQKGYFEDLDFLQFQRQMLQECCDQSPGWTDWGWTESNSLDRKKFANYREHAQALISQRNLPLNHSENLSENLWGWKDPRTSLILDFWIDLIPDARFLLIYRYPWDVADSILRLQAPVFIANPDYALRIWHYYNQNLLDFYRRHQSQSLLISVNGFLQNCDCLLDLMYKKFGADIFKSKSKQSLAEVYDRSLFGELSWTHPTVNGINQIMPEAIALLQQLDQAADLPSDFNYQFPNQQHSIQTLLQLHYAQIFSQSNQVDRNQSIKKDLNSKYDRETIAVMELILGADSNCIDVGCHMGEILTEILKFAPSGTHYCFEPLPSFYQGLLNRFQNLKNVNFSNFALSDSERETSFIFVESNPGFSGFQKRRFFRDNLECEEKTIEITVKTQLLDNLIPQSQIIDLIKIDVEGGELEVLKGALQTIKRNQPVIVFEHGNGAADCYGTTPEMVYDLLVNDCGLSISTMERFLAGEPHFSLIQFCHQFNHGINYYFIAYKRSAQDYLDRRTSNQQDLINQIKLLREYRVIDQEVIAQLENEIAAMKTSKFWRLRQIWFWLKGMLTQKKT